MFTSPAWAQTSTGPSRSGSSLGAQPTLVVGGHDRDRASRPRPTSPSDFDSVEWARAPTTTDDRRGAEQPVGLHVPSGAASSSSRAAARHEALATVAPLTNAAPVPAGRRSTSTSHRAATSCSVAATGDITGRAAFWSHAAAIHAAPSATGSDRAVDEAEVAGAGGGHRRRAADPVEQAQRVERRRCRRRAAPRRTPSSAAIASTPGLTRSRSSTPSAYATAIAAAVCKSSSTPLIVACRHA